MAETKEKQDISVISADELSRSYAFFHRICQSDTLDEEETKDFLKKTLLSEEDCAQILQLSDMDQDGQLTISEFILAVHYTKTKLLGLSLPDEVPQSLRKKVNPPFNLPPASDEHIAKCKLALLDHRQLVNENGMLPVEGARYILSRSGLSSSILYHIWRLSDADKDELLSFSDFVVAVHLVNLVLKGYTLPVSLDHKVVLRSKKIQSPDFTLSSPRVKMAHIPWIQSGSSSSPTLGRSPSHFVLPSTPLSPSPGLPTPEHPFMSFTTFARNSPSSPLSQYQEVPPELPPRHPPAAKKRSYVNLIIGPDGPAGGQDLGSSDTAEGGQTKKQSPAPPAVPPRHSSIVTPPTQQPTPTPNSTGNEVEAKVLEQEHAAKSAVSTHIPATATDNSRLVLLKDAHAFSPPPPTKLGSTDANLEFMKSLEDLTSIGFFVAGDPVASPVERKESGRGSDFTIDMNASLDDLVAALSEMESSLQTLEETSDAPLPIRSDPEVQTPPQCQQQPQPPEAQQSQEGSDLISSLKSVGSEEEQHSTQGGDLVSSLGALHWEGNGTSQEGTDPAASAVGSAEGCGGGIQSRPGNQRPAIAPKPAQKPTLGTKPKPNPKNGFGKSNGTGVLATTRTSAESLA